MDEENITNTSRAPTRARVPGGLKEVNSAFANSRSGLLPPGTIAKQSSSSTSSRMLDEIERCRSSSNGSPGADGKADMTRSKSVTQPPESRRVGPGNSTTTRSTTNAPKMHGRANSVATPATRTTTRSTANGSFSSRQPPRPHSSLAGPGPRKQNGHPSIPRPATSLDTHEEEPAAPSAGKRKGRRQSHCFYSSQPISSYPGRSLSTLYGDKVQNCLRTQASLPDIRKVSWQSTATTSSTLSLCRAMDSLDLSHQPPPPPGPKARKPAQEGFRKPPSPSKIPTVSSTPVKSFLDKHPSPSKGCSKRNPSPIMPFLTKDSTVRSFNIYADDDWDREFREKKMEEWFTTLMSRASQAGQESFGLKEAIELYKTRISELEASRNELNEKNLSLRVEIETVKARLEAAENALRNAEREHEVEMESLEQRQRIEAENAKQESKKELEAITSRHEDEVRGLKRRFEHELDDERSKRQRDLTQLNSQTTLDMQRTQIELDNKDRELGMLQSDMQGLREHIERERKNNQDLRQNLDTASGNSVTLESSIRALKARIEFLESGREEQSAAFERANQQMVDALAETNEAKEKLRKEETLRRKLHNQVQELKGNIRVFCRVRPTLETEPAGDIAQIQYPDDEEESKEINVLGQEEKNSLGAVSRKNNNFSFDRVFGPSAANSEVFDEISQLVQSALDGYNVCIFCYGQSGSGKTYTMSSLDGMIPRAVHQIYETARELEDKGWTYKMEGNFVEVYNENLNDLLGDADDLDKKKHEIRHDMQRGKTIITDVNTVHLESPEMVESILKRASANRSVAATKANERSSRSHSVFILKLLGQNHITGERSEGTLNLVDLAGSERLSHSGATGERLKETQNINRSLSSLGDVIAALGQGKDGGHIPYRNSKEQLTYLLQFSLGGNSKTLMFVMVSPLQGHMSETLTSLKFATKVHNTHIGTAKKQTRIRD